jgi:Short C-terminal domain
MANGILMGIGLRLVAGSAGCAVPTPIQPASTSKSGFEGAVYKGETVRTGTAAPDNETYRVFIRGATGFVSIQSVRDDAETRAKEFCANKGKAMESLSETTAKPPYILGNFPRIEIVFDCVVVLPKAIPIGDEEKYSKLFSLKKLLDAGAITEEEFEREKAKILNTP